MKMMKVIEVFNEEYPDIPEKADKFMEFWQEKINLIPEEHRGTAVIEIEAGESWGSPYLNTTVRYKRPETDEEKDAREGRIAAQSNAQRDREIEQLRKLKEKYGDV